MTEINKDNIIAVLKKIDARRYEGKQFLYLDRSTALRILGLDMTESESEHPEIMKVFGLTIFEILEDKQGKLPRYRVSCLEDLLKVRQIIQKYLEEQEREQRLRNIIEEFLIVQEQETEEE